MRGEVGGGLAACDARDMRVRHRLDGGANGVALTFDDCDDPVAWTRVLDILAATGAPAMFFGLGMRVVQAGEQARRTVADGHAVGAHGWDHTDLTRLAPGEGTRRLRADRAAWRRAGAADVTAFRPPFGRYDAATLAAAARAGYEQVVLWDVDPRDWQFPSPGAIVARVLSACTAGSVVDLHVTAPTADALPAVIRGLRQQGLACVTPDLE